MAFLEFTHFLTRLDKDACRSRFRAQKVRHLPSGFRYNTECKKTTTKEAPRRE
jgi:hypothetical protein